MIRRPPRHNDVDSQTNGNATLRVAAEVIRTSFRRAAAGNNVKATIMRNSDNQLYERAKKFLMRRVNYETFTSIPYEKMQTALARVADFLEFVGNPQNEFAVIHVAGTKGKGTVCGALDQIYRAAGYRVGLFTSPHLDEIIERFQINGVPCDKNLFAETTSMLVERWKEYKRLRRRNNRQMLELDDKEALYAEAESSSMTFFEWSLIIALTLFARAKVDLAILEVGLGGRYDATNVCYADASVVTSISYDHCEQLGNTLAQIANEKLGIVKSNAPLVCGVGLSNALYGKYDAFKASEEIKNDEFERIQNELINKSSAPLDEATNPEPPRIMKRKFDESFSDDERDFAFMVDQERIITKQDVAELRELARNVAERFHAPYIQVDALSPFTAALPTPPFDLVRRWNFEIALKVVAVLAERSVAPDRRPGAGDPEKTKRFPVSSAAIRRAAENFSVPARFEIVSSKPLIVVDGAHNRASVAAFLKTARERFPNQKLRALFAVSIGKDVRGMLAELASYADEVILTERTRDSRSTPLPDLIEIHEKLLDETCAEDSPIRKKFRIAPDFRAFIADYCARPNVSNDLLCAIGSFYFAAEVRKIVSKPNL